MCYESESENPSVPFEDDGRRRSRSVAPAVDGGMVMDGASVLTFLLSLELLLERDFLLLRVGLTSGIGRRGSDLIRG